MADFCSLCGNKLSFFGSHHLVCGNQDEMFCSKCHDVIFELDNLERGKYLLEHGKPDHPDEMRKFIDVYEERAKIKKVEQPPTRPCTNCDGEMVLKLQNFRIGADGDNDLFDMLLRDQYHVDLYACPECGKVELYTANFAAIKHREARQAAEKAAAAAKREQELAARQEAQREHTSCRPGRNSNEKPPWEK